MKLDHINLVVRDMAEARRFYQEVLGMTCTFEKELYGSWFEEVTGVPGASANCVFLEHTDSSCRLELLEFTSDGLSQAEAAQLYPSVPGFRHIAFETHDMDALRARLVSAGVQLISPPVEVPFSVGGAEKKKRLFYFRDPEGNILEAAAYA